MKESEEMYVYEYAVIRYMPRVEREEFFNIGLLMMCKRLRWIRAELHLDAAKLGAFRCAHTPEEIMRQSEGFLRVAEGELAGGPMADLPVEERFRWLTAVKSTCLTTSRPHPGLTSDPDATFRQLFADLVS